MYYKTVKNPRINCILCVSVYRKGLKHVLRISVYDMDGNVTILPVSYYRYWTESSAINKARLVIEEFLLSDTKPKHQKKAK